MSFAVGVRKRWKSLSLITASLVFAVVLAHLIPLKALRGVDSLLTLRPSLRANRTPLLPSPLSESDVSVLAEICQMSPAFATLWLVGIRRSVDGRLTSAAVWQRVVSLCELYLPLSLLLRSARRQRIGPSTGFYRWGFIFMLQSLIHRRR